jgi:hypothetical protein
MMSSKTEGQASTQDVESSQPSERQHSEEAHNATTVESHFHKLHLNQDGVYASAHVTG